MNAPRRIGATACAILVFCGCLAARPALASNLATADPPQEAIYAIIINGERVSEGTALLQLSKQVLLAKTSDLTQWRLKIPPGKPALVYRGESYYTFASLGAINISIDPLKQEIAVSVPVESYELLQVGPPSVALHPTRNKGAFINYDLYGQATSFKDHVVNGLFSTGLSSDSGVLLFRALAMSSPTAAKLVRLDTVWQHDDPTKRSTLLAGDAISSAGNLGSAVRFGGVQIASNFATDPTFIAFPLPVLAGQAAVPSTLSVYVNNVETLSQQVPPGPFTIASLPVVTGAGQIQLSVRDLLGRTVLINQPYYASPQLLKHGLTAYSYESGFERRQYELASNDYGAFMVSATNRFGVTDRFTDELHVEYSAQRGLASASGNWALGSSGSLGVAGLGVAASSSQTGVGNSGEIHYSYMSRRFNLGARFQANSINYTTLATLPAFQPVRQVQLQVGSAISQHAYVNAAYTQQQTLQSGNIKITAVNASFSLHRGTVSLSAIHSVSASSATEFQLLYSLSLDPSRLLTLSSNARAGAVTSSTELSQNLPATGVGLGYRTAESVGANAGSALQVTQQDDSGTRTLQFSQLAGTQIYSATVSGAVIFFGKNTFVSRRINDAFGLAKLAGYPGVRVFVNSLEEGRTDADGNVALPDLVSYQSNDVVLESTDLPLSANVPRALATITPYAHSAVKLNFEAAPAGGVLFLVVSAEGQPIEPGTLATLGSQSWPVADNGEVFVFGLEAGQHVLQITQQQGACHFTIVVPKDVTRIPELGQVVCK
ncbi:MAG: fimbria/pilus outer membrane usher protein [Candidatus Eremiobacteraeota bacterium]|nr:fimbria/pilus outer membrane usher protein [Candidatus Eremiobacteraeota bacterium]